VLIVGSGSVGLMMACEVRRRDVSCRVIDKYAEFRRPRALNGVQPRALDVLDSLGTADKIVAESYQAKGIRILWPGTEVDALIHCLHATTTSPAPLRLSRWHHRRPPDPRGASSPRRDRCTADIFGAKRRRHPRC